MSEKNSNNITIPEVHKYMDGGGASRHGNFHNYYAFNPIIERFRYFPENFTDDLLKIQAASYSQHNIKDSNSLGVLKYLDIGSNEGDITLAMASFLLSHASTSTSTSTLRGVSAIGVELDSELTYRATRKMINLDNNINSLEQEGGDSPSSKKARVDESNLASLISIPVSMQFVHGDIVHECGGDYVSWQTVSHTQHAAESLTQSSRFHTFLQNIEKDKLESHSPGATDRKPLNQYISFPKYPSFQYFAEPSKNPQLTNTSSSTSSQNPSGYHSPRQLDIAFLFSVTMWIHLSSGDKGLKDVLRQVSSSTDNIIIEPQPWKCYLTCRKRWKKAHKPVSVYWDSLEWKTDVDDQIINFLVAQCGFTIYKKLGDTHWGRQLVWLVRNDVYNEFMKKN